MVFPGCSGVIPVRDLTKKEIQVLSTCLQSYWFLHLPDIVDGFIFFRVGVEMAVRAAMKYFPTRCREFSWFLSVFDLSDCQK